MTPGDGLIIFHGMQELRSGVDQVARRFRRRVGGGSSDAERSQSVIVAPYYPKGRIGIVGELEPAAEEGRH